MKKNFSEKTPEFRSFDKGTSYVKGTKKEKPAAHIQMRHKQAFKTFVDGGMKDIKGALMSAGYPESTASRPTAITSTHSWKVLMDEFFPDDFLAEKHKELLNTREVIHYTEKEWDEKGEKYLDVKKFRDGGMNVAAVAKGLDMAYKLKGMYKESNAVDITPKTAVYNLIYKPEFREATRLYEQEIIKQMQDENARNAGRKSAPVWGESEPKQIEGGVEAIATVPEPEEPAS